MAFTQRVYVFEIRIFKQGFWRGRCFMILKSQGLPILTIRILAAIVLKPYVFPFIRNQIVNRVKACNIAECIIYYWLNSKTIPKDIYTTESR